MIIHQLSVFLENKSGRLTEVLEVLGEEGIRINALSVADTSEFGILRLIVSDPQKAKEFLKKRLFIVSLTEVISIMVPSEASHYAKVLKIISDKDISIEYTYAFSTGNQSTVILRCSNNEAGLQALKESDLIKRSDLYKI